MSKTKEFFIRRDGEISGPFSMPLIRKQIQDGVVGGEDHIGRTESGPWKTVREVPSLESAIPPEALDDEWDELPIESESYAPTTRRQPPQPSPVPESGHSLFFWGIGGVITVLLLAAAVGGIYLATGEQSPPPIEVSEFDAQNRRARAEFLGETAVAINSIQVWLKKPEPTNSEATATIASDAEVPDLNNHLATLKRVSGTATAEPDVARECQRLINILEAYRLRQKQLATAVAEFTAATPTTIPYDALEASIGDCRKLNVSVLKTRADWLAEVVAVSKSEDSTLGELIAMEEFAFQVAISERPVVSDATKSELLALAKFFAIQKVKDAAMSARENVKRQEAEAVRVRNQENTATKAFYLAGTENYEGLDQRHGSFTVVRWHSQSPTYFVPTGSGNPQDFRVMASTLGLSVKSPSENALEVRLTLDMLSRLKKWLDARRLEKDTVDKAGKQQGHFLASTNVKRVLDRLKKQVYVGFEDSMESDSYEWSSLMFAGSLEKSSTDGQETVFLNVERVIVTRLPCRATALANRTAIAASGHVVTTDLEFDVFAMNEIIVSPLAMVTLGLDAQHLLPPTEERPGVKREEYLEMIVRGDENQIRQTNKTIQNWYRGAIDRNNLILPEQNSLEERIKVIVNSAKKSQLTRWARILRLGAGIRLYHRSANLLGGSPTIREDVASAAFSDGSLRRSVPASVSQLFDEQILQQRLVLTISSDGVWIVTGSEAVTAVRKLLDLMGFYGDQKKEKLALSQASAFYKKFIPTIRRPVIPPPPKDPLYPTKGPMPRPPRGGPKTTTATVVSVSKSRTGNALLDEALTKGALDGAVAAAKTGDERLLRLTGGRTETVTVRNKNYAGDAAWDRYRAKVRRVESRYREAVSQHQQRIASGAYNRNPVWIKYQSALSLWTKEKDATIAAWKKLSADLLAAWKGGRQASVLAAITDLRKSRRAQMAQIQTAVEAFRSDNSETKSSAGTEPMPKQQVHLIPSLSDLLEP